MCPIYEYRCLSRGCRHITDAYRSVEDRNNAPQCESCGNDTRKIISIRAKAHSDLEPYYDDNLETHITSKRHRRKVMREKGVSEKFGKGWT